jgi:hypothetical protein
MTKNASTSPKEREISQAIPDTTALKALAHPDRLRMLGILRFDGPDTATGLAKRLGLNSGATSYHLRQLAEYGFIEPAAEIGNKRERWWQAKHESTKYDPSETRGEALEAGMAMAQAVLSQHAALMQKALQQFPDQPTEWRKASNASDYIMAMTADEALALKEKLTKILWDAVRRSPASNTPLPSGTRQFMVMLHTFPFPGIADGEKEDPGR